ncbi:HAMP domain-containing sensor histidine kinase [uncultured Sulfitobacter sp.]|uniref:sensor histidine kinase n=1 Tax=uncultured Sulfitobacter sp. TaxID=191468 RepID=UPI00260D6494|nr:HAMP domain-containing sensor histidine kinase [uncultured Sulfitobacter sp.]
MSMIFRSAYIGQPATDPEGAIAQVRDYGARGLALGRQRMLIFAAALVLQAFYFSVVFAAISTILIVVAEIFDGRTFVQARKVCATDPQGLRQTLRRIHAGALFGACVIGFFAITIAFSQATTTYLMPMLFLIAAAVFAATHNQQLVSVLAIRLAVYGVTFVAIPLADLIRAGGGASNETWLNLFTSLFVLFFVVECSVIGLRSYRTNKNQLNQLRVENRRANSALVTKTEFFSTVSHELRTPLTSIRASLDMALAGAFGPMPAKSSQVLSIAQRNATRLSKLIDELLDLQKIEVGMMQFDFCDVQLAGLISDTVADNRSFAEELEVTVKMLPVDTNIFVHADPMRLEQVITNLLSNAAKFSDPGSVVTLGVVATDTLVRIDVSDEGVGIDPADHDRIFDSFSQLDNVDIRKVNGTGLGLNISKRIIQAHDGTLDFEPNTDRGTTFFVELARIDKRGPNDPETDGGIILP